jgi:hypothetical protein
VTQKGERRGISIGHQLEGILKLIRHISLISQTVWSSHMTTTEKKASFSEIHREKPTLDLID